MTSIIPITPYLLTEYQAYLDHRRYGYTSRRGMMLAAQRVIDQFPDGIPLDEDQVVEAACITAKTISTTRTMRGFGRRFYEFLVARIKYDLSCPYVTVDSGVMHDFSQYLIERGYRRGVVLDYTRVMIWMVTNYGDQIPADLDTLVQAALQYEPSTHMATAAATRFYEFIETQSRSAAVV